MILPWLHLVKMNHLKPGFVIPYTTETNQKPLRLCNCSTVSIVWATWVARSTQRQCGVLILSISRKKSTAADFHIGKIWEVFCFWTMSLGLMRHMFWSFHLYGSNCIWSTTSDGSTSPLRHCLQHFFAQLTMGFLPRKLVELGLFPSISTGSSNSPITNFLKWALVCSLNASPKNLREEKWASVASREGEARRTSSAVFASGHSDWKRREKNTEQPCQMFILERNPPKSLSFTSITHCLPAHFLSICCCL